ncbi:thioredoxin family protein [bacterium]|nr:thioredoxin family protein [bacterium]
MVLTPSHMKELGSACPDFSLPEVTTGKTVSLADFADKPALLVMFICAHCPYVKHIEEKLADATSVFVRHGCAVVGISSNSVRTHPGDAPDKLAEQAREMRFEFPYLYDETQDVARAFDAACTPDFFLYDRDRKLVYRGQFDGSRPGNGVPVTGVDLTDAVNAVVAGHPVHTAQIPSIGCNIKWHP